MNMTTTTTATTTTRADKRTVTKAGRVIVHGRSGTSATFGAVEFVPVPGHEMGLLIGRGHKNLNSIQAVSGVVRIEVNYRRGGLELFGGVAQVREAAAQIERQLARQARRESSASVAVSYVSKPAPKTAAQLVPSAWDFPALARANPPQPGATYPKSLHVQKLLKARFASVYAAEQAQMNNHI